MCCVCAQVWCVLCEVMCHVLYRGCPGVAVWCRVRVSRGVWSGVVRVVLCRVVVCGMFMK